MGNITQAKVISILREKKIVFDFLSKKENWPKWAILSVNRIVNPKKINEDWIQVETPHGVADFNLQTDPQAFLVDINFRIEDNNWSIFGRLIDDQENEVDCTDLCFIYQKNNFLDESTFAQQITLVNLELNKLKEIIESQKAPVLN